MKNLTKEDMKYINKQIIQENAKLGAQLVNKGFISEDEFKELYTIDPSKTKKYLGWMAKQWAKNKKEKSFTIDELRSGIEEYHLFLESGKAKTRDIFQFKDFEDLKKEIDELNETGDALSLSELEGDYEVYVDTNDLLIVAPNTHEAARKLGMSQFAGRTSEDDNKKDCAWCITFKNPDHFDDYYFNQENTIYFISVRSMTLQQKLVDAGIIEVGTNPTFATLVDRTGKTSTWNAKDVKLSDSIQNKLFKILNIK
jgi:hypothetical protein